jgi:hypothetical protein
MGRCVRCGTVIAGRRDRRFCSSACRTASHRERHAAGAGTRRLRLEELVDAVEPHLAEAALVAGISEAARESWTAAAWLLERRYPSRWAARGRGADVVFEPDELLGT